MKRLSALLLVTLPFAVLAASSNPDESFCKKAAQGGLAEVELGNLAQQKSNNQSVKDFGAMMLKDHSAANHKLTSIARGKDISLATSPSLGQMATKRKLELLTGDTFDKSYVKGMIKDHEEDIAEFNKEALSGRDPDAKAFATATLPTLRAHLKQIKSIAAAAGNSGVQSSHGL